MADEKIIQLSKNKILVLLLISIVFVWIGWWMFSLDGLGLVAIVLFGLGNGRCHQ
jgi:hypothetical protein